MKTTLGVFALLSAPVAFAQPIIPAGGWGEVYGELMQCIQGMGHCRDAANSLNAGDIRIELGHHSKEECTGNSLMFWVEPYSSMITLKDAVETRDSMVVANELVLVRRSAGAAPISTEVSAEFVASASGSAMEGYVRCGGSEYIYMTTSNKAALYSAVSASGSGMDVAIPVPMDLRISPWVTLYEELNPQSEAKKCQSTEPTYFKSLEGFKNNKSSKGPRCSWDFEVDGSVSLKVRLPIAGGRTLEEASELAATFEANLMTHGRHLMTGEDPSVVATGANHLVVTGVDRAQARELATSGLMGDMATWIELATKFELTNYGASITLQSGGDHMQTGVAVNSTDLSGATYPLDDAVTTPFHAAGITGKNQVVGVGDSGLQSDGCFFTDPTVPAGPETRAVNVTDVNYVYDGHRKLTNYYAYSDGVTMEKSGDHGTHVAGTVAGDIYGPIQAAVEEQVGPGYRANRGVAYDAKISFFDIGNLQGGLDVPDDLSNDYLQHQYDAGARIQTNSWGVSYGNQYSGTTRHFDSFSFAKQDFVALVASGNQDYHRGSTGSIGSPATSKNVISVGASTNTDEFWRVGVSDQLGAPANNFKCEDYTGSPNVGKCQDNLAPFTSGGPTFDHRIAPDVVAPGFFTLSADSGDFCALTFLAGTSMATPAVAGAVALVRQYLMEGFHLTGEANLAAGFTPMGALLKAIIVNSGKDMSGSYSADGRGNDMENTVLPNQEYGFGIASIGRTLLLKGYNDDKRELFLDGDFDNMPTLETGDAAQYVFSIAPGRVEDVKVTLVWHDPAAMESSRVALINDLDLEVYDKNGFQYFPNQRHTRDNINNVEQTVLGSIDGTFIVKVRGFSVPMGPQPYSLVVSRVDVSPTSAPTNAPITPATNAPVAAPTATATPTGDGAGTFAPNAPTDAPSSAPTDAPVAGPPMTKTPTTIITKVVTNAPVSSDEGLGLSGVTGGFIGFALAAVAFALYKLYVIKAATQQVNNGVEEDKKTGVVPQAV